VNEPTLFELDASLPGYVHGIVSIDPPTVCCDGCGHTATAEKRRDLSLLILTCGIKFNPRLRGGPDKHRRLCRDCRKTEWGQVT
jgi:hypothetical protein